MQTFPVTGKGQASVGHAGQKGCEYITAPSDVRGHIGTEGIGITAGNQIPPMEPRPVLTIAAKGKGSSYAQVAMRKVSKYTTAPDNVKRHTGRMGIRRNVANIALVNRLLEVDGIWPELSIGCP